VGALSFSAAAVMLRQTIKLQAVGHGSIVAEPGADAACGSCGQQGLCVSGSARRAPLQIPLNELGQQDLLPGDRLECAIDPGVFLRLVFSSFLLPAILLVAGAGVAVFLAPADDVAAGLGALFGLLLGCGRLRRYDARRIARYHRVERSSERGGR